MPFRITKSRSRGRLRDVRAAALLVPLVAAVPTGAGVPPAADDSRPVCLRGTCFESEIAVTAAERARGLMHRASLAQDRGMLFVFPEEGRHKFWMKNTLIELDIVFIGADRRVVGVVHRAPPCREDPCPVYGPEADAAYALEVAGGRAAALGVAAGDVVEFRTSPREP